MNIRPKQGEVLIQMDPPQAKSDGGLLIPELDREPSQMGTVKRLGIWKQDKRGRLVPYEFKRGDKVLVNARVGRWLHREQDRMKLVPANLVLAVMTNGDS